MKLKLSLLALLALLQFSWAEEDAIATAKSHVENLLIHNIDELEKSFDETVVLMPGHELLKPKFG